MVGAGRLQGFRGRWRGSGRGRDCDSGTGSGRRYLM